jgi:lipoprotein LprG
MTTPRLHNRASRAVVLVAATLLLTACSSGGGDELSPEQTLAAAKKNLDSTSGVHIVLSTEKLPSSVSGLLRADGTGTHAPAFQGTIKVAATGVTADADVVATDGAVYAKLPFTTKFVEIDPADYGAPDPADLMNTEDGLSSMLTKAEDVTQGKQQRNGKVVLNSYSATVPGEVVAGIIPSASAKEDFDATFTVDDQNRLGRAVLTGPFYPDADDVTYTIEFSDYGASPTIKKP